MKIEIKPIEYGFRGGAIPNDYEIRQQVNFMQKEINRINELVIKDTQELYIRELLNRINKAIEILEKEPYLNKNEDALKELKGDVKNDNKQNSSF